MTLQTETPANVFAVTVLMGQGKVLVTAQSVENPCTLCLGRKELNIVKNGGKTYGAQGNWRVDCVTEGGKVWLVDRFECLVSEVAFI